MDQYPKIESIGSIEAIILASLEVQVYFPLPSRLTKSPSIQVDGWAPETHGRIQNPGIQEVEAPILGSTTAAMS